jgi:hypothetical protein
MGSGLCTPLLKMDKRVTPLHILQKHSVGHSRHETSKRKINRTKSEMKMMRKALNSRTTLSGIKFPALRVNKTVTAIRYPMFLMSVRDFVERYSDKSPVLEVNIRACLMFPSPNLLFRTHPQAHQTLLRNTNLLRKYDKDISKDTVIFVSHEWLGFTHPDPTGQQTKVLTSVLKNLMEGHIDRVNTDGLTRTMFGDGVANRSTTAEEWKAILKNAWIWV